MFMPCSQLSITCTSSPTSQSSTYSSFSLQDSNLTRALGFHTMTSGGGQPARAGV